jgi:hypothetical protein
MDIGCPIRNHYGIIPPTPLFPYSLAERATICRLSPSTISNCCRYSSIKGSGSSVSHQMDCGAGRCFPVRPGSAGTGVRVPPGWKTSLWKTQPAPLFRRAARRATFIAPGCPRRSDRRPKPLQHCDLRRFASEFSTGKPAAQVRTRSPFVLSSFAPLVRTGIEGGVHSVQGTKWNGSNGDWKDERAAGKKTRASRSSWTEAG